jgi:hypothetical protein
MVATMKKLILFFILTLSLTLQADINVDDYDLTESQRELVQRLIERGLEEHLILKLIENMQRGPVRPTVYIPEHTEEELRKIVIWAEGGAFNAFASYAGVEFQAERYMNDCPNWPIFNFGRATATAHISIDVLRLFNGRIFQLENLRVTLSQEEFRESYLNLIKDTPHYQYLY